MAFNGVGKRALPFFKALAFHQTKDWFEANRAIYEEDVKAPLGALAEDLGAALAKANIPIKGDKKSLFRIHRDVRFSKDKSPYKTNAGLALTRSVLSLKFKSDHSKWMSSLSRSPTFKKTEKINDSVESQALKNASSSSCV